MDRLEQAELSAVRWFLGQAVLLVALSGSFFLSGPSSQFQKMFHENRKVATLLYLGSLGVTLVVALIPFGEGLRGIKAMLLVILLQPAKSRLCKFSQLIAIRDKALSVRSLQRLRLSEVKEGTFLLKALSRF